MPAEPPPSEWTFPDSTAAPGDVVAVGGDLEPGTILAGYRRGLFPMHDTHGRLAWWSPVRRGVIPLDGLVVTRSLRKSVRRFQFTIDNDFPSVIESCADPSRGHGWINDEIKAAYLELHRLGWAHSIETRDGSGKIVGGLYGVAVGGAYFGESMFYVVRDASKAALVHLVQLLWEGGAALLDVQWATPHLRSLGAVEIGRSTYLRRLAAAVGRALPEPFA